MRSYLEAQTGVGPVIFDRGIPDVIGYLRLCGLPVPTSIIRVAERCRYARKVFIAPHWPTIFVQDAERKQDLAEAEATYYAMMEAYTGLEYELIPLPLASISERAEFVRTCIA